MSLFQKFNNVSIWWDSREICQACYEQYRESCSNSCTLTALIFANRVSKTLSFSVDTEILPSSAMDFIGSSINDGNKIYHDLTSDTVTVNIPEAISILLPDENMNFQLNEWFFTQVTVDPLDYRIISLYLSSIMFSTLRVYQDPNAWDVPPYLFATLITDCRCVMICFDLRTSIVTFFDPNPLGGCAKTVIAQSKFNNLDEMLFWYVRMLDDMNEIRPQIIEITFLSTQPEVVERIKAPFEPYVTVTIARSSGLSNGSSDDESDSSDPEST